MKIIIIIIFTMSILPFSLFSTVGDSSLSFLTSDFDPACGGQANSLIAAADDINSVLINPAGLGHLKHQCLRLTHSMWMFGFNYESVIFATPLIFGGVGFSLAYFHMPEIDEISDWKNTSKKLNYYDILGSFNYGKELRIYKGVFAFGAGVKYIYEKLGFITGNAFLFDIGVQYKFAFLNYDIMHKKSFNFGIGIVAKNLGQGIKYSDDIWGFVPSILGVGLFYKPLHYYRVEVDFETLRETGYRIKIGNEFYFLKYITPRLGYCMEKGMHFLSLGAGLNYFTGDYKISFDYTFKSNPTHDNSNFIGLTIYKSGVGGSTIIEKKMLISKEGIDISKKYPQGVKIGLIHVVNTIIDITTEEYFKMFPSLLNNFLKDMDDKSVTIIDRKYILDVLKASDIKEKDCNSQKALKMLSEWVDIDLVIYGYTLTLNNEKKLKIEIIDVKTLKIVSTDLFSLKHTDELDIINKVCDRIKIRIKQLVMH